MGGFRRTRHGVTLRLGVEERLLLSHLFGETHELLGSDAAPGPADDDPLAALVGIGTAVTPPQDPALRRLLPDGHREDDEAAADFRRYTEHSLRERKRGNLETARATLDRDGALRLADDEALAWLLALTDVRLVLAERMGLRTDEDHERLEAEVFGRGSGRGGAEDDADDDGDADDVVSDPRAGLLVVYDFLTWLQETLVEALPPRHPDLSAR